MKKKTFKYFVEMAAKYKGENKEIDCSLSLAVEDQTYKAYSVSVAHCDLLFYCEGAVITYLIDLYGEKPVAVLHNIEKDAA